MALEDSLSASPADDKQEVDSAALPPQEDDKPDSSPEQESEDSLSDAIQSALEGDTDESSDSDDPSESTPEDEPSDGDTKDEKSKEKPEGEESEKPESEWDEGDDVKQGQRVPYDRFRKVIEQRKGISRERDQYKGELEKVRPQLEDYQQLQTFVQSNNLSANDVSEALQLQAMIRNDPAKAMEKLQPVLTDLNRYVGKELPGDLQQKVNTGEISEEHAAELVKTRNENQRLQREREQVSKTAQQRQTQQQVQQARQDMASAVTQVEAELRKNDPDYDAKLSHVQRALKEAIAKERPVNGQEAAQLTRRVYKQVSDELARLVRRRETPARPSSTDTVRTGGIEHEPESMGDAIAQAMKSPSK